ncbi:unnamed protein product [Arctia plantaginis]|uniref:ZAD domain-containing protein n=1 Tax=Arctia plantaginis TaxID=874455 RepID=A0A8S0ZRW2_ARCPL|nr:unnamed protein product [Arctia plantaginis]
MAERLCTRCRESVENRRSYTWISREENHIEIAQIIIQELLDQQAMPPDFICRPCWQRAERTYQSFLREEDHAENVEDNLEADPVDDQSSTTQPSLITLPGFVRSPDTRRTYVFQHCENSTRHRIPDSIVLYISQYNLLLSENSRVCGEHLQQDLWHLLAVQQNNIAAFTANHIVRALSI